MGIVRERDHLGVLGKIISKLIVKNSVWGRVD